MDKILQQLQMAQQLSEELAEALELEEDPGLIVADLLDSLARIGLQLAPMEPHRNVASEAYIHMIQAGLLGELTHVRRGDPGLN